MRYFKIFHRALALFGCAALFLYSAGLVHGQDSSQPDLMSQEDSALQAEVNLPRYKGEGSLYLGFRLVDVDALSRVAEYEDEDSSFTFGVDGIACGEGVTGVETDSNPIGVVDAVQHERKLLHRMPETGALPSRILK